MRCQNCGENGANFRYVQIINGVKTEMNLCEECARKLGLVDMSFSMPKMNFSNMFDDMFEDFDRMTSFMPSIMRQESLLSDSFLNPYEKIEQNNETDKQLDLMIKNMQKNRKVESNKENAEKSREELLKELQAKLEKEIKEERYEDAAKTRDEIKKIK